MGIKIFFNLFIQLAHVSLPVLISPDNYIFSRAEGSWVMVEHGKLNIHASTTTTKAECALGAALNFNCITTEPLVKSKKTSRLILLKSIC